MKKTAKEGKKVAKNTKGMPLDCFPPVPISIPHRAPARYRFRPWVLEQKHPVAAFVDVCSPPSNALLSNYTPSKT
jgi:hypothetical protein